MKSTKNAERPRIAAARCKNTVLQRIEFLFVQLLWHPSYHRVFATFVYLVVLVSRDINQNVKTQILQYTYPSESFVNRAGITRERCLAVALRRVRMGRPYHTEINVNQLRLDDREPSSRALPSERLMNVGRASYCGKITFGYIPLMTQHD